MEFDDDENGGEGTTPQFGAIFMSNIAAKVECFKRRIFGLPSAQANFVKQVKAGMLLFLFEFQKRELFGVFQATSDGTMNIVPHAFSAIGQHFSAQVRFKLIWTCSPLSEVEFGDAIRDNYYSAKKFNFGLSKNQVLTLLQLFNSKRSKNKIPRMQFTSKIARQVGKDRKRVDSDRIMVTDTFEHDLHEDCEYATVKVLPENSLDRVERIDDDRFSMRDMVKNEHEVGYGHEQDIWMDYSGEILAKKRKIDNEGSLLVNDVTGNELFDDHGPWHATLPEVPTHSFGEVRRPADFCTGNRVKEVCLTDTNLGSSISFKSPGNIFNKKSRLAEDDMFLMNGRVDSNYIMGNNFGPDFSTVNHKKPFGKGKLPTENSRFLRNSYSGEHVHNMDNQLQQVTAVDHLEKPLGRRVTDDSRFLMNSRLRLHSRRYLDDGLVTGPTSLTDHFGNSPGRATRATDVRPLMIDRVETDRGISCEQAEHPIDKFRSAADDETCLIRDRVENFVDNGLGSGISTEYSRYNFGEGRILVDDGRFRKSDRLEYICDMGSYLGNASSSDSTAFYQSKQNQFMKYSKVNIESDYSSLHDDIRYTMTFPHSKEQETFTKSYRTSHDAMVTTAVPYDPEVPDISYQQSRSSYNYEVQDHSSYQGSEGGFLSASKIKSSPQDGLARCLDVASGSGNDVLLPNTSKYHELSYFGTTNILSNAGHFENNGLKTTAHEGFKNSLYPKSSLASVSKDGLIEKVNKGSLSYAFGSSGNSPLAVDNGYHVGSQDKYEYEFPRKESSEAFPTKKLPPSDVVWSRLDYGASSPQVLGLYHQEKSPNNHQNELYQITKGSDTKDDRPSVFARLSVAREEPIRNKQEHEIDMGNNECDVDPSVQELMDFLHQSHTHWVKMKKCKPSARPDDNGIVRSKEKSKIQNQIEYEQPMITGKREIGAEQAIIETGNAVFEETRLVDFKRRSETKKNISETCTKASVQMSEGEKLMDSAKSKGLMDKSVDNADTVGLTSKPYKRRKLVRPDFGKKEFSAEGNSSHSALNLPNTLQKSTLSKNNIGSSENAVKSSERGDKSSFNAGVDVTVPASSEANNSSSKQSSESKPKGNSDNCGVSFKCRESDDGKELSQVTGVVTKISQIPLKETNQNVGGGLSIKDLVKVSCQNLLSMIGGSSTAQDSPPVACEAIAVCGNSEVKEETNQVPLKETNQKVFGGSSMEDLVKVSFQDLICTIGGSSFAQDSLPVVFEATAGCGNSKDKEENVEATAACGNSIGKEKNAKVTIPVSEEATKRKCRNRKKRKSNPIIQSPPVVCEVIADCVSSKDKEENLEVTPNCGYS